MATEYVEILLEKIEKNYFLELLNNKKICDYEMGECYYYSNLDYGKKNLNKNEFNEKISKNYNCMIMLKKFEILNLEIKRIQLIVQQNNDKIDITFNCAKEQLSYKNKKIVLELLRKQTVLTKDKRIYIGYEPVEDKDMQCLIIINGKVIWKNDNDNFWKIGFNMLSMEPEEMQQRGIK